MLRGLKFVAVALAALWVAEPAIAQYQPNRPQILRKLAPNVIKPNLNLLPEVRIAPSQAAAIAQADYPGSKVLKVRQRGGVYIVTLAVDGSVIRVRVDGTYGSIL
ncbi:MAG: PepSY domain-containing protein [Hyphomicrobiales bacterium]|nr:PepSY domain-containing protein [Hyphomicrobiales bacterium]